MKDIGVSHATEVLSSLAGKLGAMLVEEAGLLSGVRDEVVSIKGELASMSEFLKCAEELPGSGGEALSWVDQVRRLAYDAEDCIDEYTLHLHYPNNVTCCTFLLHIAHCLMTLKARHRIATEIQKIKIRARDVSERRSRYFRPGPNSGAPTPHALPDPRLPALFVEETELVGIDGPRNKILGWLMAEDEPQLTVISVVGMGGLGKTTLARRVYENPRASCGAGHFQCRAWITVSQSFEIKGILKFMARQVFSSATKEETDRMEKKSMVRQLFSSATKEGTEQMEVQDYIEILREHLQDKRYVVVLDDVWTVPDWEIIMPAFPANTLGSRIMVTTRIESVANRACRRFPPSLVPPHVYNLQPLTHEPSWDLFRRRVFSSPNYVCPPHLKEVSEGILKKCGGLPLAIVTFGGLLACRSHQDWQNLHDRLGGELESNGDLGAMKTILNFSYNDLPPQLKRCFLYLSLFPEDYTIDRMRLVRLWVAQGFVSGTSHHQAEEASERCFNELINRSLIQPWELGLSGKVKICRVHDVIRELILSKSKKEMYISALGVEGDYVRHLSVHEGSSSRLVDLDQNMRLDYLRSLIVFPNSRVFKSEVLVPRMRVFKFEVLDPRMRVFKSEVLDPRMRLLRVLDLQDCKFSGDMNIICKFLHLKYLCLQYMDLPELPKSIGNLQNLETLYIKVHHTVKGYRYNKRIKRIKIPPTVVKLQQLRHLMIENLKAYAFEGGMSLPRGVGNLKALQTLYNVDAKRSSKGTMRELAELTQLRQLGVTRLTEETAMEFCTALEKLSSCLRSLSVGTAHGFEGYGFLDSLSSPPLHLQSLTLSGNLRVLPRWVASLRDVAKIAISGTTGMIMSELLLPLRTLPSLINLHLDAWDGFIQLCFGTDGFRSLKALSLDFTTYSKISLKFEEGAMPNLEKLRILESSLNVLRGIKYLASLKEIEFKGPYASSMLEDIVRDHPNNPRLVQKWV